MHILIAEDRPTLQLALTCFLSAYNHHPMVASTGQEAVDLALTHYFDLILMDLKMPVMDGLTATREIRARLVMSDN